MNKKRFGLFIQEDYNMRFRVKAMTFLSGAFSGAAIFFLLTQTGAVTAEKPDGFSSATPVAVNKAVPQEINLLITGQVKRNWAMKSPDFAALAQTRLRCIENTPDGTITGAYIYQGVPLLHILEGVMPQNRPDDPFDRPLDMVVAAENPQGGNSWFSYGELTMCSDDRPVIAAFHREELLPSKDPEEYRRNSWHGPHRGLRLVSSRDRDNSRHIDGLSEMALLRPKWPTPQGTPTMKIPGKDAPLPNELTFADGANTLWTGRPDSLDLPWVQIEDWRRIGHGRGLKSQKPEQLSGYRFSDFLQKMFSQVSREDAFLVVAIDGYRVLFSGREVFEHDEGRGLLLQDAAAEGQGWSIQASGDFFVDRCVWGLSHIIRIDGEEVRRLLADL